LKGTNLNLSDIKPNNQNEKKLSHPNPGIICHFTWSDGPVRCQYLNHVQKSGTIRELGTQYPGLCSVSSLFKTPGGNNIWLMTIGTGNRDSKPGIAIVGGVDGKYLIGSELAVGFAEKLLKSSLEPEIKELLDKITFYIFPDVSPDASAQFFSELKYERSINSRTTDDDRDFVLDEDPCEDLKQGWSGYPYSHSGPLRHLDRKWWGQKNNGPGRYFQRTDRQLPGLQRGTDNDKDGLFNEDGAGGVSFNHNFTYNYEEFGANSGLYLYQNRR